MELKEFIKTTLLEIQGAVTDIARDKKLRYFLDNEKGTLENRGGKVKFDVALTVSEKKGKKGEVGIHVPFIKAGVGGEKSSNNQNSQITRIQFSLLVDNGYQMWKDAEE